MPGPLASARRLTDTTASILVGRLSLLDNVAVNHYNVFRDGVQGRHIAYGVVQRLGAHATDGPTRTRSLPSTPPNLTSATSHPRPSLPRRRRRRPTLIAARFDLEVPRQRYEPGHRVAWWRLRRLDVGERSGAARLRPRRRSHHGRLRCPTPARSTSPPTSGGRSPSATLRQCRHAVLHLVRDDGARRVHQRHGSGPLQHAHGHDHVEHVCGDERQSPPQDRQFFDFTVPTNLLVSGTNTIAVEVHQNYRASGDLAFNLSLIANP